MDPEFSIKISNQGVNSIKEYLEYKRIVGNDDEGNLFTPKEYEEYKNKVLPSRIKNRLFTSWTNKQGMDCKLIGPETECFCSHRYKQHVTDVDPLPDTLDIQLKCRVKNCRCSSFHYIPHIAGRPLKCICKHSSLDHDPKFPYKCQHKECKQCLAFRSSYRCQCGEQYSDHKMTIETKTERQRRGHPVGHDVPYQAMGGITGFSSLCDGYERLDPSGKGVTSAFKDSMSEALFEDLSISDISSSDVKKSRQPNESELDYYHRRYEEKLKESKFSRKKVLRE